MHFQLHVTGTMGCQNGLVASGYEVKDPYTLAESYLNLFWSGECFRVYT